MRAIGRQTDQSPLKEADVDLGRLAWSVDEFREAPSWQNFGCVATDAVCLEWAALVLDVPRMIITVKAIG